MKRSPLKRYTPLKAKKAISRVSKKGQRELARHSSLKRELIEEFGDHCMTCGDQYRDFRGISLSHIIPKSRMGKTDRSNCILECYPCHEKYEKHPERRPEWQRIIFKIAEA